MTWISLVCLLALSSSVFGRYTSDFRTNRVLTDVIPPQVSSYGSGQQMQGGMLDQSSSIQRPFLTSVPVATPTGYGQQQQQGSDLPSSSFSGIQQDTQSQQQFMPAPQKFSTGYGSSYGAQQQPKKPLNLGLKNIIQGDQGYGASSSSYGTPLPQRIPQPQQQLDMPVRGYGSIQSGFGNQQQFFDQQQPQQITPTPADLLCRGQRPETVIPLEDGRKFVVCLDESKGVEQACPKGLHYHMDSRRCERKLGPLENPCASQPCLNGGQCVATDPSTYQCQCQPGFDGKTCEMDARICQTQQPCGQTPDSRCQSFRLGAALDHVCICQQDTAYGLNCQQAVPNPCQGVDGPQPLAFSDKGFIMCDGERMFVESCPGGTIWDDLNKACVWPDMQGVIGGQQNDQSSQQSYGQSSYGQSSYGQQRPSMIPQVKPSLFAQQRPQLDQTMTSSYGQQRPQFDQTMTSSYGQQRPQLDQSTFTQPRPTQFDQSMMSSFTQPRPTQFDQSAVSSYGAQIQRPQPDQTIFQQPQQPQWQKPQQQTSFGQDQTSSFGGQQQFQPRPQFQQQQDLIQPKTSSPY